MADKTGYIGRNPGDSAVIVARQTTEPTGIQTDFTFAAGYTPGYIDAYINGARLIVAQDYTATDGSIVSLTNNAVNGDVVELVAYKAFNLGSINNATGNFDVGNDLTVTGVGSFANLYVTGISTVGVVTGGTYYGDGDNLTNVGPTVSASSGTGSRVLVTDTTSGKLSAVANNSNLTWNTDTSTLSSSNVDVSSALDVDGHTELDDVNIAGVSTFSANIDANAGLDVDGHTELDDVNIAGVSTFGADVSIADKIIHTGDTNTSIRFPGADTITAETGGSERLRVDSSGMVGIGTVNPEDLLHLWSGHSGASSVGAAQLILESSGSTNWVHFKNPNTQNAGLLWSDADATEKAVIMYNHNTDDMEIKGDDDIVFKTDSVTRLTIDASGNSGFTGIVTASKFDGPGNVPAGQTGTVTLAASDAGKHVAATGTVTLGTGIYAVGDAVTIWNNSAGNINIVVSAVTCYNAADATTTSPRVLAQRGLATILCVAANTYVISGSGLS